MSSIAHIRRLEDGSTEVQALEEHLHNVAARARHFASVFGNGDWAEYIGMLHDLGKFNPDWQKYIKSKLDEDASNEGPSAKGPPHSGVGAIAAFERAPRHPSGRIHPAGPISAYCIAGHHGGLNDWEGGVNSRLEEERPYYKLVTEIPSAQPYLQHPLPHSKPCFLNNQPNLEHAHLWIRMLFSCLVDADFLDTEAFMQPEHAAQRSTYPPLSELRERYLRFMEEKERLAPDTPINQARRDIRRQCINAASAAPGFFSLTIPTGGGKTLSSIGFALEHAVTHGLERIIMAIPYTSITEQTAAVLRYGSDDPTEIVQRIERGNVLFGDAVIEHHSNLDPERETVRSRLASENWDAPIIVTTTVQLFESLFAVRPSACRKLHNLARSVIIIDEAQLLPPEHLRPILSVLRGLVEHFGASVVFMTATQPVLEGRIGSPPNTINGLEQVTPLVTNTSQLARHFERVELVYPNPQEIQPSTWEELSAQLCTHRQVLAIVNSRADCRQLHAHMPEGTVHLSALMCPEERSTTIAHIKRALREGREIRVVSTQLIEAGVDIDFPVVYRALAGLDSIAQAAGRCNREGKHARGQVIVFAPPKQAPPGLLRKGDATTRELLRKKGMLSLEPDMYAEYFRLFYRRLNTFDEANFDALLVRDASEFNFQFRTFAERFSMIDGSSQHAIIVRYTDPVSQRSSLPLIEQLRARKPDRTLMRQLQRFSVTLYRQAFEYARSRGYIESIEDVWVQATDDLYVPGLGLVLDQIELHDYVV
jgi:CRISPR-associated endonuclease/helicase Cas3